jgi:peptidoglycan/xylan/chitin deacetylase (PgdA/CDA1 family)
MTEFCERLDHSSEPEASIVVTFDDGYHDNLTTALPLLEAAQVPATVYMVSGALDDPAAFWWDLLNRIFLETAELPERLALQIGPYSVLCDLGRAAVCPPSVIASALRWNADLEPPRDRRQAALLEVWAFVAGLEMSARQDAVAALAEWAGVPPASTDEACGRPMTCAELRELASSPLIEIGGHTVSHRDLAPLSTAECDDEIRRCRDELVALIGKPVSSFAYPFGRYGPDAPRLIEAAGYTNATCSQFGLATRRNDRFQMPRVQVPNLSKEGFEALLDQLLGPARNRPAGMVSTCL